MAILEYFPEERRALASEVKKHPELAPLLNEFEPTDFPNRLATIAAFCGVIVDGVYTNEELNKLCSILTHLLIKKRSIIVVGDKGNLQ